MVNDTKSWPKHSQYHISIENSMRVALFTFYAIGQRGFIVKWCLANMFYIRWNIAFRIRGLCLYGSDKQKQSDVEKLGGGSGVRGEGPEFFSDATATHLHQGLRGDLKHHHHHHDHHHHHQHHHHHYHLHVVTNSANTSLDITYTQPWGQSVHNISPSLNSPSP